MPRKSRGKTEWGKKVNIVVCIIASLLLGMAIGERLAFSDNYVERLCPKEYYTKNIGIPRLSTDSAIYYLYPPECSRCDLVGIKALGKKVGAEIEVVESKAVAGSQLFMVKGGKSEMAEARNYYNILKALCSYGFPKACETIDVEKKQLPTCLSSLGLSENNTLIFLTASWCRLCKPMKEKLQKVEKDYSLEIKYIDESELSNYTCLHTFLNLAGGYPQLFCTRNLESHTGVMSRGELEDFMDRCEGS